MTTAALLLAALCVLGAAALLDLLAGPARMTGRVLPYLAVAAGSILLAVAGFRADLGHTGSLDLGTALGFGHSALRADPLAGLFLALIGVVATPVALAFAGWARRSDVPYRGLGTWVALTIASVAVVILADNAFLFLFGWEGVSVAFYLLTGYRRDLPHRVNPSMLTFTFSKASGAALLVAFGLLYGSTGSFTPASWTAVSGGTHTAAYALLLAGFAAKVGVVPLQVWMPSGYGAAPGPARALMSAVAANVGFYGMWRTFGLLGKPPVWVVVLLLLAAAFTALLGIAHASVQSDLQRVIAYSSVENGGLISAAFAIALAGAVAGQEKLVAAGLLTATLQMVAHAFAKSSLFLASAAIEQHTGRRDLDGLRGIGRQLPLAGVTFTTGALTLAGLPLTIGFVSEWYLLECVMQLFRLDSLVLKISLAVAGALLALAIGFAGFTFVRLVGLTILGGDSRLLSTRHRHYRWTELPMALPALACVAVAAASPWEVRFLARGLGGLIPAATTTGALKEPWVLQPVYTEFSALSPSWLAVELPVLAVLVLGAASLLSWGRLLRVRRVPAWRSATGGVSGDARYTPFGFANPTRHVLGNLLMTRSSLAVLERETEQEEGGDSFAGPDMPPGGGARAAESSLDPQHHHHAEYQTDVVEVTEAFLYRPLLAPLRALVTGAKKLQSGRLDAYITYMLIALVALIAIVVGLS